MRLTDLSPGWLGSGGEGVRDRDGNPVPARSGIGVGFDCPCGCADRCYIEFSNPLDGNPGRPNGWERTGETFETLTLRPSIQRVGGCAWHGFITSGEVTSA